MNTESIHQVLDPILIERTSKNQPPPELTTNFFDNERISDRENEFTNIDCCNVESERPLRRSGRYSGQ
jgi:hypothetical protein